MMILGVTDQDQDDHSYITNCYFKSRPDEDENDFMFKPLSDGHIVVHLDRYAIIPIEYYHELMYVKSQNECLQDELDEVRSKLARIYHTGHWNIEEDEERGILKICRGDHHSSEPCENETYAKVRW